MLWNAHSEFLGMRFYNMIQKNAIFYLFYTVVNDVCHYFR